MPELAAVNEARVDVGALAGSARNDATRRVAEMIAVTVRSLKEDGHPLNDLQVAELIDTAITSFDGLERSIAAELVRDLTQQGVAVWGLHESLKDLEEGGS